MIGPEYRLSLLLQNPSEVARCGLGYLQRSRRRSAASFPSNGAGGGLLLFPHVTCTFWLGEVVTELRILKPQSGGPEAGSQLQTTLYATDVHPISVFFMILYDCPLFLFTPLPCWLLAACLLLIRWRTLIMGHGHVWRGGQRWLMGRQSTGGFLPVVCAGRC